MARLVKSPRTAGKPYSTTVTWDPVSRRNYLLRLWLTLGGVPLVIVGATLSKGAPAVGGIIAALGLVMTLGTRLAAKLGWLPYTQPAIAHEGEYRSWVGPRLLIGIGVVLVCALILFAVMAARYH